MRKLRFTILLAFCAALPGAALAQTTPQPSVPATDEQPTLSEKLSRTDGVLTPAPSGDDDMTHMPPNVGTMPVIPPQAITPPGEMPGGPTPDPK